MRVLFDYQIFSFQKFGGISNMYTQLMLNMPKEVEFKVSLKESDNYHLQSSGILDIPKDSCNEDNFLWGTKFRGKGKVYSLLSKLAPSMTSLGRNKLESINQLKKGDFDIFHPTYFYDYFLPYLKGKPFVLTIYDMISEKFFPQNDLQTINKRKMVKTAAHIIAISEKTKQDIVELLHVDPAKISVIHLAVPEVKNIITQPLINDKYILFVGHRFSYKNFIPMAESLSPILNRNRDIKLVCTGIPFTQEEIVKLRSLGIYDSVIHLRPSDEELRNLYSHAMCFIFPSLYEGFGIPILEAYQSGCPVLLNNKSCFPEIAQDAAIYFNLDSNGSNLTEVMNSFLQMGESEREELLNRQCKRLADFSWKKSAEQLADVYRLILDRK